MALATTFAEVLPAQKSNPHAAIHWTAGVIAGTGTLTIRSKKAAASYFVTELPVAWAGRAFRFQKPEGETGTDAEADNYDVFCGKGRNHTCECKGFLRWRTPCKHVLAALALLENDWI